MIKGQKGMIFGFVALGGGSLLYSVGLLLERTGALGMLGATLFLFGSILLFVNIKA